MSAVDKSINGGRAVIRIEAINWPDGQEYVESLDPCIMPGKIPVSALTPEYRKALMDVAAEALIRAIGRKAASMRIGEP